MLYADLESPALLYGQRKRYGTHSRLRRKKRPTKLRRSRSSPTWKRKKETRTVKGILTCLALVLAWPLHAVHPQADCSLRSSCRYWSACTARCESAAQRRWTTTLKQKGNGKPCETTAKACNINPFMKPVPVFATQFFDHVFGGCCSQHSQNNKSP